MKKQTAKAQTLVPDAQVRAYARAVSGPYPRRARWAIVGGCVGLVGVIAALTGIFLWPGGFVLIVVANAINAPRAIAVTDLGVASMERSFWSGVVNGGPTSVLARLSADTLRTQVVGRRGGYTHVQLGGEALWLKTDDYERLLANTPLVAPTSGSAFVV